MWCVNSCKGQHQHVKSSDSSCNRTSGVTQITELSFPSSERHHSVRPATYSASVNLTTFINIADTLLVSPTILSHQQGLLSLHIACKSIHSLSFWSCHLSVRFITSYINVGYWQLLAPKSHIPSFVFVQDKTQDISSWATLILHKICVLEDRTKVGNPSSGPQMKKLQPNFSGKLTIIAGVWATDISVRVMWHWWVEIEVTITGRTLIEAAS